MVNRGALQITPMLPNESDNLAALMAKYPTMQFADACVVRLSELNGEAVVYTTDRKDFSIYRKNRREVIKAIMP